MNPPTAIVLFAFSFLLLTACDAPSSGQQTKDIAALPAAFPILEKLGVTEFRNQDWCQNMVYQRGKFSHNNTDTTCNLFGGEGAPFDPQAQQDFDAVAKALAGTGVKLSYLTSVSYGRDGKLAGAEFHLATMGRISYVYEPGYGTPPPDMPGERQHKPLDKDWYCVLEDWN
jgi:hypothetical protein